jgi:hypothetical protein
MRQLRHPAAWFVLALLAAVLDLAGAAAQVACKRDDFEAVVAEAARALRDLNQKNKPAFQARLRELRDLRGWTPDEFIRQGAIYVQDARIAEFDERSNAVLESIQRIGTEGASSQSPSCQTLEELRGLMRTLVAVQTEKWTYMFRKIEQELKR